MNMLKKIRFFLFSLKTLVNRVENIQLSLGRIENLINSDKKNGFIAEFKVFSQWGEDGILQSIINNIQISNKVFVEFGVETYTESNTRFLLFNNNWSGLVIDGSIKNVDFIKSDPVYWRFNLKADCAFIDKDNINEILSRNGLKDEVGVLSIDIDGNDYWVWQEINVINPAVVICEYNSLWGSSHAVTTPYDPHFVRQSKHFSCLYYGASIKALELLANRKGYSLVAGNSSGNNVFFVRNDLLANLKPITSEVAWVQSQFRESRDQNGNLSFLSFNERRNLLSEMPLVDVKTNRNIKVSDLK